MSILSTILAAGEAPLAPHEEPSGPEGVELIRSHVVPALLAACDEFSALIDEFSGNVASWNDAESAELLEATRPLIPAFEKLRSSVVAHRAIFEAQEVIAPVLAKLSAKLSSEAKGLN